MEHSKRNRPRANCICVPLGEMKGEFAAWCQRQDVTINDAVRQIIGRVLGGDIRQLPQVELPDEASRTVVKIQFSAAEYAAVSQAARRMGFPMSRFLVAMVRALIAHEPQLGDREVAALEMSNYQLAAIGRNLNQLARALNANPALTAQRGRLIVIDALRREIDTHLKTVYEMQQTNLKRWRR